MANWDGERNNICVLDISGMCALILTADSFSLENVPNRTLRVRKHSWAVRVHPWAAFHCCLGVGWTTCKGDMSGRPSTGASAPAHRQQLAVFGAESQGRLGRSHGAGLGFLDLPILLFYHQAGCREQEEDTKRLSPVECRGG